MLEKRQGKLIINLLSIFYLQKAVADVFIPDAYFRQFMKTLFYIDQRKPRYEYDDTVEYQRL